jgi:tetratricopeptide (TPR) repeat protein
LSAFRNFLLVVALLTSATARATDFTGSASCESCHVTQFSLWQNSHHDLAMQMPTPETVLGDFDNAEFTYNGITTTFYTRGDKYFVRTDGEEGKLADFPVDYVFGVYPLQQYLIPLSRGRWQALSIAWDARPEAGGGQRWYHLYPDEAVDFKDPLHWTGPYQNWNTRCAECHSTQLEKNYSPADRSFDTSFAEIDVSCEACHGPGATHIALANGDKLDGSPNSGFPTALAQRGTWEFSAQESIAKRTSALKSRAQIDSCGRCHARRGTLGDYHYGADLLDTHRLAMPQSPLYYHDGQILDEVYVYGSFVQSKMHQAGVVCSNCHEPHSLKLRAKKNGTCAQCHNPGVYDTQLHHLHKPDSTGAQCANCHMPETTYMGVDPRRDHSLRVPRPDLSIVMGTPNACNQCHVDKKPQWALDALRDWGIVFRDTGTHPARSFLQADRGDGRSVPRLAQLAGNSSLPPIWRANAMEALGGFGGREALQTATQLLYSDDSLLRVSTVRAIQFLPLQQRFTLLQPLIDDEITSVRMEVATSLAAIPLDQVTPGQSEQLQGLFREYLRIQELHADMPGVQLQLGIFYSARGDLPSAEAAYREAIHLNPQLIAALLNLADLLRAQSRDDGARELLHRALKIAPEHGPSLHALGLLETRSSNTDLALDYLGRAAALETLGTRHRFVYAIALHDLGKPKEAVNQLTALLRTTPQNQEVLLALANYNAEMGQRSKAQVFARRLTEIAPTNRDYQQLLRQLSAE